MIHNTYTIISNYRTNALQDTLNEYGEYGYKLVNTMMVKNKHNIEEMYLFFTKEGCDTDIIEKNGKLH